MKFVCTSCKKLLSYKETIVISEPIEVGWGKPLQFYCKKCYRNEKE